MNFFQFKKKSTFIFLFIIACFASSCTQKSLRKREIAENSVSKNILQEVLNNNLVYETLRIRGKCVFKQGKTQTQFTYRIHIEKNKKIWASLSGLGIEAVRIFMEGDSAAFFNRLEHTYWKGSISDLNKKFGIQGDISALESILIGNFFQSQVERIINENQQTQFLSSYNQIPLQILISPEQKVQKIEVNDPKNGWKSELNYDNYQVFYNKLVPLKLGILVYEPQNIQASLEHKEIEMNPKDLKFNFQIPDDYKPISL